MMSVNVPTIMVGSFAILAICAGVYLRSWRLEPRRHEFGLWSAATGSAALGALLGSFGGGAVAFISVSLAQGLMLLGAALAWQGVRAFDRRRIDLRVAATGPAFWVLLSATAPLFQEDANARFIFATMIAAVYSGLIAWEHSVSERSERLASRPLIRTWFVVQTCILIVGAGIAFGRPLSETALAGLAAPVWFSLFVLSVFLHVIVGGFSFFVLVKDRLQLENQWVAATDTLTGLANRSTFLEMLQTLSLKVRGEGAFLYVDVDHVKRINDRFGHSGGDHVLKTCAEIIGRELPPHALLGRLAGAEFAAYVPFCDVERAEALGNVIRDTVALQMFFLRDELVNVTVSVGVAHGAMQVTPDELLKRADAALHSAKVRGRNAVVVWHEDENPSFA